MSAYRLTNPKSFIAIVVGVLFGLGIAAWLMFNANRSPSSVQGEGSEFGLDISDHGSDHDDDDESEVDPEIGMPQEPEKSAVGVADEADPNHEEHDVEQWKVKPSAPAKKRK